MKSPQKFAGVQANVHNHFNPERHLVVRQTDKERRSPPSLSVVSSRASPLPQRASRILGERLALD